MTKQTKWALAVVGFVVTAAVARRVGQYEMKHQVDEANLQLATLYQKLGCGSGNMFDAILSTNPVAIENCVHNKEVKAYAKGARNGTACAYNDRTACAEINIRTEELDAK